MHVSVKLGISFQTLPLQSCDNENNVSWQKRGGKKVLQGFLFVLITNNGASVCTVTA